MSGAASSMCAASAGSSAKMSAESGHGLPYMTAVEEEALQALLRRAKQTGQLSAQLMQARVSGLVITEEQKAMVEEGRIMTFPDQQFPWVPKVRAKAKAKMAPTVPTMQYVGEDHGGAMTDASKRRFMDDLVDEDESFAEFEVVQAIKEFNGEFSTSAPPPGMALGCGNGPYGVGPPVPGPGNPGLGPVGLGEQDAVDFVHSTGGNWSDGSNTECILGYDDARGTSYRNGSFSRQCTTGTDHQICRSGHPRRTLRGILKSTRRSNPV